MPDEKFDEKEMEKREEKSPEEKSWDEKWRRDPLGTIVWAAIFIWAGLVFLASNLGLLEGLVKPFIEVPGLGGFAGVVEAWPIVLLGAGVIVLIEVVIRLLVPAYRRSVTGSIIFAAILIGVGLGDLTDWNFVWALILIGLGLSIIVRGFTRSRGDEDSPGGSG